MAGALSASGGPRAELVPITTSGDRPGAPGAQDDKSRFVKEIEQALLRGEIDLGVHSAKDVPGRLPEGLAIASVPAAEDPRDALVGKADALDELPQGARVGTSSLRRRSQLLAIRPDLEVSELRGNVDTRLRKLAGGGYDAIVVALAGLRRLGRDAEAGVALETADFVPAAGQGLLALESRAGDMEVTAAVEGLNHAASAARLDAERAFVTTLEASCRTPVGTHAQVGGGRLRIHGYAGLPDGRDWIRDHIEGDGEDPTALGTALAERMLAAGAADLLRRAEASR